MQIPGALFAMIMTITQNPNTMTQTRPPDDPPVTDSGPKAANAGAEILDMAAFSTDRPSGIVAGLRDHWRSLCDGRAVPDRADVTAAGLGPALDYAFILERISPGSARLRLAGRHLIDLMGMEVRGMPVSALLNPGYRGRLSDVLESVFQAPQLAELFLLAPQGPTTPACPARMLLMPLKSDLGDVTRILGCLVSECSPGRAPRRFDLISEKFEPVIEGAPLLEPGQEPASRRSLRAELEARDFDLRNGKCAPDLGEKAARRRRNLLASVLTEGRKAADTAKAGLPCDAADGNASDTKTPPMRQTPPVGHPGWRPRLVIDNDH